MKCIPVSLLIFVCLSIVFDSCNSGTKPNEANSSIKIEDAKKLQERANELILSSNFIEAEELLKKAITLHSNSSIYVDLFRLYAIQSKNQEADESIKKSLLFKNVDPSAYYLNGKYIFTKYKRDSIESVLYNFRKASELGNSKGEDYYNAIKLIEACRKAFLEMDVEKLMELNFQDAMIDYFGSLNEAQIGISNAFNQYKQTKSKLTNLDYFIPDQIFTNTNNSKLAKFRIMIQAIDNGEIVQMPSVFLLISINGNNWYLLSKSHKDYLSKYFSDDILSQVFK
jgi:tetratricopeptide (TPR) repeat protein